jgi:hypothetical protein
MDTSLSFANRSAPRAASIAKVFAGLLGMAALGGIYPAAAVLATALAVTWKAHEAKPSASAAALIVVSAGAAERNSLGLRAVPSYSPARGMRP